jgi:excinuclease UvrABC ATPase subunit
MIWNLHNYITAAIILTLAIGSGIGLDRIAFGHQQLTLSGGASTVFKLAKDQSRLVQE